MPTFSQQNLDQSNMLLFKQHAVGSQVTVSYINSSWWIFYTGKI